jgi:hypothetical protein
MPEVAAPIYIDHEVGVMDPTAPKTAPNTKQAETLPRQRAVPILITLFMFFDPMANGVRIGQECSHGLKPWRSPRIIEVCAATKNDVSTEKAFMVLLSLFSMNI